mmetsp:Transcript_71463/g.118773  ORF Transcript_71463/g.118773 Transcript_71463/m.118773 type:complete len:139 (-) Transcript_71463:582-998(-)
MTLVEAALMGVEWVGLAGDKVTATASAAVTTLEAALEAEMGRKSPLKEMTLVEVARSGAELVGRAEEKVTATVSAVVMTLEAAIEVEAKGEVKSLSEEMRFVEATLADGEVVGSTDEATATVAALRAMVGILMGVLAG